MATAGLVIGKFYPPHRGHKHLIDSARAAVDHLSIIVCDQEGERPHAELRARWLREIHPDAEVIVVEDRLDPDDSKGWAEYTISCLGYAPDVVFTSEDYGPAFARYLGCRHILVDRERTAVPISGTMVRGDPLGCWEFLEPPVRGYYARRICLVGAESTGKTTLAQQLARRYGTVWVPEYGREYSESKLAVDGEYRWRSEEFALIAEQQCRMEDAGARACSGILICDTDAFATSIWHRRYMGHPSPEVESIVAGHQIPDLYLLTSVDTPFVQDGTRDGEHIREWMHQTFLSELTRRCLPFSLLEGSFDERFRRAVALIEELIKK